MFLRMLILFSLVLLPASAQAGPLCGLLRGAGRVASAPFRAARANREARQEARAARQGRVIVVRPAGC